MSFQRIHRRELPAWFAFFATLVIGLLAIGCKRNPPAVPKKAATKVKPAVATAAVKTAHLTGPKREQALALYTKHCAGCHGEKGDGQGIAARFIFPKPRDFRSGRFRLVSTTNGVPTMADIDAVLVRGMPGSAMPPWPQIADNDRKLLAELTVDFRREGLRESLLAFAEEDDEEISEREIQEIVNERTTPGPVVEVPRLGNATAEAVARGQKLYLEGCATCHGKEGRGNGTEKMVDEKGVPTRPRDLTKGIFKGSPEAVSLFRRTLAGMPGSPMPAAPGLKPAQVTDLVYYVLSLSSEQQRAATVLNREKIVASRVQEIPQYPADEVWNDVEPVRLRMTPLWWRDDFEPNLFVQAVHDGNSIALRLSWNDATADQHAAKSDAFEDAVAVELFRGEVEPFLGMGNSKSPVDVWLWDADRQSGGIDVEQVNPNIVVDRYPRSEKVAESAAYNRNGTKTSEQAQLALAAKAAGNQIVPTADGPTATVLEAGGPGTATFRPPVNQTVNGVGRRQEGRWSVVMTRTLEAQEGAGVPLTPGERASVAFAVWDGSRQDRNGQKLITIWQDLTLEK